MKETLEFMSLHVMTDMMKTKVMLMRVYVFVLACACVCTSSLIFIWEGLYFLKMNLSLMLSW